MPPKPVLSRTPPLPQNDVDNLVSGLVKLLKFINENHATMTTLPSNIESVTTTIHRLSSSIQVHLQRYSFSAMKPETITTLLPLLINAVDPTVLPLITPQRTALALLELMNVFVVNGSVMDIALRLISSQNNFLYRCVDALQQVNLAPEYRGYYYSYFCNIYRFAECRIFLHTGYPITPPATILITPKNASALITASPKTQKEYYTMWSSLIEVMFVDILAYFSKPTESNSRASALQWKHFVYIIDIVTTLASNNRMLYIFAQIHPDQTEFDVSQQLSNMLDNTQVSTTIESLYKMLCVLLSALQDSFNTILFDPNPKDLQTTTQTIKLQKNQYPLMLNTIFAIIINALSPNHIDFETQLSELTIIKDAKKKLIPAQAAVINALEAQFESFVAPVYQQFIKQLVINNLSLTILPSIAVALPPQISGPELQSNMFFTLLLILEASYRHMVYFATGLDVEGKVEKKDSDVNALQIIITLLVSNYNSTTWAPTEFVIQNPKNPDSSKIKPTTKWLLSDQDAVQYCCCMLDLLITVMQQSSNIISSDSDFSIPIRVNLLRFGVFQMVSNLSVQLHSEVSYARSKRTVTMKPKPVSNAKVNAVTAANNLKALIRDDPELQLIPAYLLANRLFYILSSLFSFSHYNLITHTNKINEFITASLQSETIHKMYLDAIKAIFPLFAPSDIRDTDIFDNNETCDSLYCMILILQSVEFYKGAIAKVAENEKDIEKINAIYTTLLDTISVIMENNESTRTNTLLTSVDKQVSAKYNQLLKRNVSLLSMLDTTLDVTGDTNSDLIILQYCKQFITDHQENKITLVKNYQSTLADAAYPPQSTLLPRAQPMEAFLVNIVNKIDNVDAAALQSKIHDVAVGYEDDFDENDDDENDNGHDSPEQIKSKSYPEDEDDNDDFDEDDLDGAPDFEFGL